MINAADFGAGLRFVAVALLILTILAVLRRSPKTAVFVWLLVVCLVPVWQGATVIAYLPAFTIVGLLAAISLVPLPAYVNWSTADLLFALALGLVVIEAALGMTTRSAIFDFFTAMVAAFAFGRLVTQVVDPQWIYRAFAFFFTGVGLLALLEFATGVNVFIEYLPSDRELFDVWGGLQPRGPIIRAEGAFGHSIGLGCSLAIAVAMTMGTTIRPWLKTIMLGILLAASVVSFSRTGMVAAAAGLIIACLFQKDRLTRFYRGFLLGAIALSAAAAAIYVRGIFLDSGDEAENSALYRGELVELVTYMRPLGLTSNYHVSTTREVSIGGFRSIDNAALLFGLIYGWLPLLLVASTLVVAVFYVVRRRATPPVIAIVAQIPAFLTVALITQYGAIVWFTAGMAVSTQVMANDARRARRLVPGHEVTGTRDSRERQLQMYLHTAREARSS